MMRFSIVYLSLACLCLGAPLHIAADDASVYTNLVQAANTLARNDELSEALDLLNKAIEVQPDEVRAYKVRGNVYFALENYSDALCDFDRIIELTPQKASAYLDRAAICLALQHYDKALSDVRKSLEIQPKNDQAVMLERVIRTAKSSKPTRFVRMRAKGEKLRN
jgi:tetratricopeptide (TPR) repeat protein